MPRRAKERARKRARGAKRTTGSSRRGSRMEPTTTGRLPRAKRLEVEKGKRRGRGTETRRRTKGKEGMLMALKRPLLRL